MHHFLIIAITLTVNADALPSKKNIAVENDTICTPKAHYGQNITELNPR